MRKLELAKIAARKAFGFEAKENFRSAKVWWSVASERFKGIGDSKNQKTSNERFEYCSTLDNEEED